MEDNLEEWTAVLNLWPLVEYEVERHILAAANKLLSPDGTERIEDVRRLQGEIVGMRVVLAIPRRMVEKLETSIQRR